MASEPRIESLPGRRIHLRGITQGVGMRPFIHRIAHECGVTGRARNTGRGVTIEAFGSAQALDQLLERLEQPETVPGAIEGLDWEPVFGRPPRDFAIARSTCSGEACIALAPDLATCPECIAEVGDPDDRRFGYAFTSCTACGPRFSIARELPYDRSRTSMDAFPLCPACRREYTTVGGRRHHAETNACPDCGPTLALVTRAGEPTASGAAALEAAARWLCRGAILAVRGIGGYHLVADACDARAVAELRERKRRPRKPFAVMVRDLDAARALADLSAEEAALLAAAEASIILVRRREGTSLAPAIAPGLPWVGLFLPYTPLHHELLATVDRPLVMTSGNLSGEPIACDVAEAESRLASLVDGFLHHDRAITAPCDDSVARVIAGRPCILRRSRGFVPRAIPLTRPVPRSVLACGAQLASVFCLAQGDRVWPSQHLGDLDSPEAVEGFARAVERMEQWLGAPARIVAHDLHPHYASTRYALAREAELHVPVQHHHAHAVAAMAEHGLEDPTIAVVFDGTGLGPDGHAWGGELLLADADGYERLATLRPIALAGGEVAIHEVWRLALAALDDAFDGAPPLDDLGLFRALEPERVEAVRALLRRGVRCLPAHGAGRWFDALGSLVLEQPTAAHQGDIATLWNAVASEAQARPYPFELGASAWPGAESGTVLEIDLRPMVRAAVSERLAQRSAAEISSRFHATLIAAVSAALERLRPTTGTRPVVLSGGCFQNAELTEGMLRALTPRWNVLTHRRIPPGDGGIALGQTLIAAAAARRGDAGCGAAR